MGADPRRGLFQVSCVAWRYGHGGFPPTRSRFRARGNTADPRSEFAVWRKHVSSGAAIRVTEFTGAVGAQCFLSSLAWSERSASGRSCGCTATHHRPSGFGLRNVPRGVVHHVASAQSPRNEQDMRLPDTIKSVRQRGCAIRVRTTHPHTTRTQAGDRHTGADSSF